MAKDRLPELRRYSSNCGVVSSTINGSICNEQDQFNNSNYDSSDKNVTANNLEAILNPYSEIRIQLAEVASNLENMRRLSQSINLSGKQNEMETLRQENLRLGNNLINRFQGLKIRLLPKDDYSLVARMNRNLFYGLYRNYIEIWTRNETFLQQYEQKLKKNLQIQSRIINCNATDEEIEGLMANKTTNLFVGNILEETERERCILRDLMNRYDELKNLEKSIEEVNRLFQRIQTLVLDQGDTIERVEYHAQQASLYVDKGADDLDKADQLHKKAVKKKLYLIIMLMILIFLLLMIAALYQ